MFVIDKLENHAASKEQKNLPCRYRGQNKSWINRNIFALWVRALDGRFEKEQRKVALIVDNCPSHP